MGIVSGVSRFSASVIGTLTLLWAAIWLYRGYYLGGVLIAVGAYAALPWERSRHMITGGKLGVGGFLTERIAFGLWAVFVVLGITALIGTGGITP